MEAGGRREKEEQGPPAAVPSLSVSPDVCRAGPLSRSASASCLALALPVSVSCQDKCLWGAILSQAASLVLAFPGFLFVPHSGG